MNGGLFKPSTINLISFVLNAGAFEKSFAGVYELANMPPSIFYL
jgi:hypothetical protein